VQNGTIHEKKAQSFFAAAQYCGRKKGAWLTIGMSHTLDIFLLFLHFYFLWPNCFFSVFK